MGRILPSEQIRYNEPMDRHCSFRTGGPADALVLVRTEEEMASILKLLRDSGEPYFLLGRGTNLLIGDGGYRGVIVTATAPSAEKVQTASVCGEDLSGAFPLDGICVDGNRITAGAGATLKAAAMAAMEHGLTGLEFAAGIPGTVGGGLVMNAGAYGGEMRLTVRTVRLLMPDGSVQEYAADQMEFGYRTSLLRRIEAAALRAQFELTPGDPDRIRARVLELAEQRRSKQPLEFPSAGSTFKRPEGYFAGKLIMDAGLAGYSVGGAQVSEKHCGFVINRGGATSAQIRTLISDVQKKVFEDSGVRLEREVIFLGDF
jgi:UDP-N-acetylmuramate dehydrogenase